VLPGVSGIEKTPRLEKDIFTPPDGGLTAWLVVVGAWCTSFCSFGWVNSKFTYPNFVRVFLPEDILRIHAIPGVGIFQSYYESDLLKHYSASTISWIPSLQIFFMFSMVCQIRVQGRLNELISEDTILIISAGPNRWEAL
jgi:hypothetical protein